MTYEDKLYRVNYVARSNNAEVTKVHLTTLFLRDKCSPCYKSKDIIFHVLTKANTLVSYVIE